MFKTSEHPFIIRFTAGTSISDYEIPGKKLNFKPFADIIFEKWNKDFLIGNVLS